MHVHRRTICANKEHAATVNKGLLSACYEQGTEEWDLPPKLSNPLKILSISQAMRTKRIVCSSLPPGAHWVKMHLESSRERKPPFMDLPDLLQGFVSSWLWRTLCGVPSASPVSKQLSNAAAPGNSPVQTQRLGEIRTLANPLLPPCQSSNAPSKQRERHG